MQGAWRAADIRAAEKTLMAKLPAGTLMQRAAAGLARRCAGLLHDRFGGVYGRTVLVLAGSGDNGGDAMYAGAALARRGADVRVIRLSDRVHTASFRALGTAGGRQMPAPPPQADLVIAQAGAQLTRHVAALNQVLTGSAAAQWAPGALYRSPE